MEAHCFCIDFEFSPQNGGLKGNRTLWISHVTWAILLLLDDLFFPVAEFSFEKENRRLPKQVWQVPSRYVTAQDFRQKRTQAGCLHPSQVQGSHTRVASGSLPWSSLTINLGLPAGVAQSFSVPFRWGTRRQECPARSSAWRDGDKTCSPLLQMCILSLADLTRSHLVLALYPLLLQWLILMHVWCPQGPTPVVLLLPSLSFWNHSEKGLGADEGGFLPKCFTGRMWYSQMWNGPPLSERHTTKSHCRDRAS